MVSWFRGFAVASLPLAPLARHVNHARSVCAVPMKARPNAGRDGFEAVVFAEDRPIQYRTGRGQTARAFVQFPKAMFTQPALILGPRPTVSSENKAVLGRCAGAGGSLSVESGAKRRFGASEALDFFVLILRNALY